MAKANKKPQPNREPDTHVSRSNRIAKLFNFNRPSNPKPHPHVGLLSLILRLSTLGPWLLRPGLKRIKKPA